ncbi:hypothetical protein IGJ47_001593 [Enterococcus sp. AZ172]
MENQSELKMLRLILFCLLNNICSTIAFTQNRLDVAISKISQFPKCMEETINTGRVKLKSLD